MIKLTGGFSAHLHPSFIFHSAYRNCDFSTADGEIQQHAGMGKVSIFEEQKIIDSEV